MDSEVSRQVGGGASVDTGLSRSEHQITSGWCYYLSTSVSTDHRQTNVHVGNMDLEKNNASATQPVYPDPVLGAVITTEAEQQRILQVTPLPPARLSRKAYDRFRWDLFSVYRKIFTFVLTANLAAIIAFVYQLKVNKSIVNYENAATAASANFCVAVLIRNEHVINFAFRCVCSLPLWAPLALRRRAAKVYSHGGVHSGCAVSGTLWYLVFTVLVVIQYPLDGAPGSALAASTAFTLFLLAVILVFAYPTFRMRMHNHFEVAHRYGGWLAVLVLWIQTIILILSKAHSLGQDFGLVMIRSPPFWFLAVITTLLVYPWTRLRSRPCQVERLSDHATRIHFRYRNLSTCMAVRLTDAPLRETHAFASIPNYSDEEKGFSVLISNAGDWTNKIITNPPSHIYVKGAPTLGVMRVALIFRKVLVIATGSGIGPCMSLLQTYPDYPMRVLWSTKNPQATYGDRIIRSVFRADPNAVIIDTQKTGRPDIVGLAYALFVQSDCEAAIVVSNPTLTKKLVFGLESRGVPAYGPVFDS